MFKGSTETDRNILAHNNLRGAIPSQLGGLSALDTLLLDMNQLSGTIPSELGRLSALKTLRLSNNQLNGAVPSELGQSSALETLRLSNNQLSGAIPYQLGELSALKNLLLDNNRLTGTMPSELGGLSALKRLDLSNNQLSGTVPSELGGLGALKTLRLSNNQLTGLGDTQHALQLVSKFISNRGFYMDLEFRGNPWKMPPEAVVGQGLHAIKTFFVDIQTALTNGAQVRSLQLLKVVLVGSASAGKTSLMRSIVSGFSSPTEGTSEEASTVGIELRRHLLQETTVEFYDCAGQVDYAGMHQTFLTQRALYLLVWDVTLFLGLGERSLKEAVHKNIMTWLYTLHLRAPGATLILVANKCDDDILKNEFTRTTERVESLAKGMLNDWKNRRGVLDRTGAMLLNGVSQVSCKDYSGITELVNRISKQGVTEIQVPPTWDLALKVVDALRDGSPPLEAARRHVRQGETGEISREIGHTEVRTLMTKEDMFQSWQNIIHTLSGDVQAAGQMATVTNWENALEGALWISEFAGQILTIDSGDTIFLDVVWLSRVLSPILSHKLRNETLPSEGLSRHRDSLIHDGILRWEFALHLWRDILTPPKRGMTDKVCEALFRVLFKLGVILPLRQMAFLVDDSMYSKPKDVLVIMRLPERCTYEQQREIDGTIEEAGEDCREVTLKWRFDPAGAPYGLVERLISACHIIWKVEQGVCWRYGALFRSASMTERRGRQVRLYTFVIRYEPGHDDSDRMLTVSMIGPLADNRVWVALQYVASAMVVLSMEWPGVHWEGWPDCPKHTRARIYLVPPGQARIGDLLLPAAAPDAPGSGCDCQLEANGVLGLVLSRLGRVVDTRKDYLIKAIEDELTEENVELDTIMQEVQVSRDRRRQIWDYLRQKAGRAAVSLGTLAVTLFCSATVTGIAENNVSLWIASLSVVVLLFAAASVASCLAFQEVSQGPQVTREDPLV